ncbi:hypothetical protein HYFRA_00011494 [Hymenoscyphus fraxineus]|uniref:Major facilitator superfamily (MFS) profile domain-containing protein n=1 Tax=Hymenoscyphus fraxineus TaxID=746836 RepID=A0A9N9L5S4_9HELO|nr:hypothetical protein HYFRA_00011494 [Hymenoscyphus fraxineus]
MASPVGNENIVEKIQTDPAPTPPTPRGVRFWGIFACLCVLSFISALDVAVITTALPSVVAEIGGATLYIWIANVFVVTSCVLQPLFGQLADVTGRRLPLLGSVVLFMIGSGISGGSLNPGMLIVGRAIQGAGAGGINVLIDIVCCDLVPMRERGKYLGLMFSGAGVAAALGPPVGGGLAQSNWRWIFYMNLPICGAVLLALVVFMRTQTGGESNPKLLSNFSRLDYLGNLIFIPSMISLLWGVVMGGGELPWSSWRIILPLVLGFLGWIAFHFQQTFFAKYPSVPTRLFANRTSAIAFILTFTSAIILQSVTYFLPIYFQAIKGTTILQSGTYLLPFALPSLVFAVAGGTLLSKFGAYRPLHAMAFAIMALALGLFTMLDEASPKAVWVVFELVASAGIGLIMPVLLPAIMAGLPEGDVASSSATYSFVRSFGFIWGVTLSGIIFNKVFDNSLSDISDNSIYPLLENGAAYAFASQIHKLHRDSEFSPQTLYQIVQTFTKSLHAIWYFCIGIALLSFLLVGAEKGLKLREELDTEYGLKERVEN